MIRTRLGSCLGLDIRGERFVGLYNITDIKALYIRENAVWAEPVVKQPMTELEDREVTEPVDHNNTPSADLVEKMTTLSPPYIGGFVGGWQSPSDMAAVVDAGKEPDVIIDPSTDTIKVDAISNEGNVSTLTIEENIHTSQNATSGEEFLQSLEDKPFKSKVVHSFMEIALNDQPIICHGYIENHKEIEINRMLKGDIVLIDLGGVYGNLIPWTMANTLEDNLANITSIENGEYFSSADKTILALDNKLFVADMHINL
jgi:hypothetical protein